MSENQISLTPNQIKYFELEDRMKNKLPDLKKFLKNLGIVSFNLLIISVFISAILFFIALLYFTLNY